MMKISKPIITNDYLLSPVQFTSLNTIVFKNVKNIYDGNEKIVLEYEYPSKIEASSRDWIGLFPRGWSTLQQYVTFEWVSQSLPSGNNDKNKENGDLTRRTITFCSKYHIGSVNNTSFYQFVYISKQIEVLGVSSYFRFDTSTISESSLELECLVPVSSKIRSTSVSDIGILMANKISSATSLDTRTQTTSIHSLQNLEIDGKSWTKPQIPLSVSDPKKPIFLPKKPGVDPLDPYSSHSEPVFPLSFPMSHCKKCFHIKRGGEFLRSQQVLQSKVGPRSEETSEFNGQRRTLGHEYMSEDKECPSEIIRKPTEISIGKGDDIPRIFGTHFLPLKNPDIFPRQLKIVMERNKVLEERAQEMKKEMEKLQAEVKRLKTVFYNTNKEKVAYEKFVKDFIKSLEKDSVVRVVNGNTEFLVKKVNYVGMEEHPRDKKTSKRERELKAVIGLQEITIRNLINSLQEKAKSVQDLNQTVKLAQAFSAARTDSKEFGSDAEETIDEVSNSDVTSEYEFSLTKPSPPEEVAVEDTEAVLDGIRRATEMELKDIGISRSLGKCSSRESSSELGFPSLSVCSYQSDGILAKKPRLFDNQDNLDEANTKVVQRKVIDSTLEELTPEEPESMEPGTSKQEDPQEETNAPELSKSTRKLSPESEADHGTSDSFYDACEIFNSGQSSTDSPRPRNTPRDTSDKTEKNEDDKKENFLVTAIIPQELDVKPEKNVEEWLKADKEDLVEKKPEMAERGKKFTCQLSIDFAAKVFPTATEGVHSKEIATENEVEQSPNQNTNFLEVDRNNQVQLREDSQKEKPLMSVKKSNKCLEIKITQVDQKEKVLKNCLQQNVVVKFEKDSSVREVEPKNSKFEFNLEVSGLGENMKLVENDQEGEKVENDNQLLPPEDNETVQNDISPRTVWNDAADDVTEDSPLPELPESEEKPETEQIEEIKIEEVPEEPKGESEESNVNLYEDSLRYEKNLEFLQQKTEETIKEEDVSKTKPTAILIQNGQTKLALIRYQ